jgi:transposase InsO family protein
MNEAALAIYDFDNSPAPALMPDVRGQMTDHSGLVTIAAPRPRPESVDLVPSETRTKAQEKLNYCQMVLELMRNTGKGMHEACDIIAMKYAEAFPQLLHGGKGGKSQLTYNNGRNWLSLLGKTKEGGYDFANAAVLCDNYKRGVQLDSRKGDEKFWEFFFALYLNKNRLPATQAYKLAAAKTKKENPFAVLPTRQQATYRIGQLAPETLALARYGEEVFKNSYMDYIRRDWTDIAPGMVMVSDSRDFDFFVRAWDEKEQVWKAVRPKICGIIDARSWYITSWQITIEPINCDTITDALALHISRNNGHIPGFLYVDNGKDFTASGFSEPVKFERWEHSIFQELGIKMVNSLPYNGRAKTIERFFKDVMQTFDKLFCSYLGSRPGERPDTAQFYANNPEKLPSLEQLCQIFAAWTNEFHNTPKRGEIHKGQSPLQIWETRTQQTVRMTNDQLFMAFLRPESATRTVHRGPAISLDKVEYYSDALWPHFDKSVMIKTDRNDPEHVYAFTLDGTLICECRTRAKIKALDFSQGNRDAISDAMANQRRQIKRTYTAIEELTGGYNVLSPIALMAMAPDAKIIKDGERTSVKGASHKFQHFIAVGGDGIEECRTGVSPVALPEGTNNLDYKEDRREEQLESFQASVLGKSEEETENRRTGESATDLADFHKFIVSKKKNSDD